jgi:N,N'-diacetyllegionaminate synthase
MSKTFIIAEVGINHCGSIKLAKKLIIEAKRSGADAVKFQSYNTEKLVKQSQELMNYQKINMGLKQTQFKMLKKCELNYSQHRILFNFCKKKEIEFISTPYDIENAKFLVSLGVKLIKVASTDITNTPFLNNLIKFDKKLIVSTGATSFQDLKKIFKKIKFKKNKTTILHCISFYPAKYESLNLRVIKKYKDFFGFNVGFSDHSLSKITGAISVSLGAKVVEKHLTLNKDLPGPDHKASLEPEDFREYVKNIRDCELMLGDGNRILSPDEKKVKVQMQKSIFISKSIKKGDIVKKNNLVIMRPAESLSPIFYEKIIGKKILKNKKPFSKIKINEFK